MSGIPALCLLILIVPLSAAIDPLNTTSERPVYKLTYEVKYNTSSTVAVTNDCGRYYASNFLKNFIGVQDKLQDLCDYYVLPNHNPTVRIYVVAKVTILGAKIVLDTYLNITSGNGIERETARQHIEACSDTLTSTFNNSAVLLSSDYVALTQIPANPNASCASAYMSPTKLLFKDEAEWLCASNLTYDDAEWSCTTGQRNSRSPHPAALAGGLADAQDGGKSKSEEDDDDDKGGTVVGPAGDSGQCQDCLKRLEKRIGGLGFCRLKKNWFRNCTQHLTDDTEKDHCTATAEEYTTQHVNSGGEACSQEEATTLKEDLTTLDSMTAVTTVHLPMLTGTPEDSTTSQSSTVPTPISDWDIVVKGDRLLKLSEGGEGSALEFAVDADLASICQGASGGACSLKTNITVACLAPPTCRKVNSTIAQVVIGKHDYGEANDFCSINLTEEILGQDLRIPVRAKLDWKYDGLKDCYVTLSLIAHINDNPEARAQSWVDLFQIEVQDEDRDSTCQSINDPHITTFDGLQYNVFYQGEFVLYQHTELPFRVHAIYQGCSRTLNASCNCAVAVQSDDDVIVLNRCRLRKKPFHRISGSAKEVNIMNETLYLNGELSPGTKIFQQSDGKKTYIYLPHGTYVKVQVNEELLNVWVVPSPYDLGKTAGICGTYNQNQLDDWTLPDGTSGGIPQLNLSTREEPHNFSEAWRVELYGKESLFQGVEAADEPYKPEKFCQCEVDGSQRPLCGYGVDIETCDIYQGKDVTSEFLRNAVRFTDRRRRRRQANEVITAVDEPIDIDTGYVPPDSSHWNDVTKQDEAHQFCRKYIKDNYPLGKECSKIPGVNFDQEVTTCVEDILITSKKTWADSARDAMKEQCLEQIQKNGSLDQDIANKIEGIICINDCSGHGDCVDGKCVCHDGYATSDCSVSKADPPYIAQMPDYGLCDIRHMNCSHVMVYGEHFIESKHLTCHLQETEVDKHSYSQHGKTVKVPAIYINFNVVECPLPAVKSYLISVSNDGVTPSDPLLFITYDPECKTCSTNATQCLQKGELHNSCIINGLCYAENSSSPEDPCLICHVVGNELQWTTAKGDQCNLLKAWQIGLIAAVAGSVIGVLVGLLLYWCCCMSHKDDDTDDYRLDPAPNTGSSRFEDARLHRNRDLTVFTNPDPFTGLGLDDQQADFEETFFHNDGRGVENGVDDTTYF